jgi:arylsulfatase A-like enzyme
MTDTTAKMPPNIILILADDMGFSDIGCYGSEIRTPNLDQMANKGLRYSQMYNFARCCPSRGALLTGLYPQQSGIGHMMHNYGLSEYQGYLRDDCITIAEVLKTTGYRTLMTGKWHVGGEYDALHPETWTPGKKGYPTPRQRGFDSFYGTLTGAGSYFYPHTLMENDIPINITDSDYYYTDAISDKAVKMIGDAHQEEQPFFLYMAYTAPHWPLHAQQEDIARYRGQYRRGGWESLRAHRHEELKSLGILDPIWNISPRDANAPAWEHTQNQEWEDMRMAVYAAQIDRMDQGIGRVLAKLRELDIEDNTLIMFMADNGGCAEFLAEDGWIENYVQPLPNGERVNVGNRQGIFPGAADTYMSYDLPWANASNSPFRLYKHWVHEGGISTPFIVHWPTQIKTSGIRHTPCQFIDIMATCVQISNAHYPTEYNGQVITPLEGESLVPSFENTDWQRDRPLYWEHEGNRAIRIADWKLVSKHPSNWELYNMIEDRTELHDYAQREPDRVNRLSKLYNEWATRCGVIDYPFDLSY